MEVTMNNLQNGSTTETISKKDTIALLNALNVPIIKDDTNYWFIRTNGGSNFENFYFNEYIAIGWDDIIELDDITEENREKIKKQIIEKYPDDTKPGASTSQIMRFVSEMKQGDYVLIPGANCDRIAFGIITSDAYIYQPTIIDKLNEMYGETGPTYLKRRSVKWLTEAPFDRSEIDPLLIPIIYSYGTIVNANPYSNVINRTIYDLYYYKGELHSTYNISKTTNVSIIDFSNFINNIMDVIDSYEEISGFKCDKNALSIKASFNSPGPVEIITDGVTLFIVLSALSIFINGAKVKFSYNIFNIANGKIDIDSPGLLQKIKKLQQADTQNHIQLEESRQKLEESKQKLQLKPKKKKKH